MRMADHELYTTWKAMKSRCSNPNVCGFENYGGRGIKVCSKWIKDFWTFVGDVGERPSGCTLDRIDVNGDYCPDNVRWATSKEQSVNRRVNLQLEVFGEILTESQISERYGIKRTTIQQRRRAGYTGDELVTGRKPKAMLLYKGMYYRQNVFAELLGISPQLLNKRLKERGYIAEDLVDEFGPIQGNYEARAVYIL